MKRYRHHWWPERGRYFPTRIAVADCHIPKGHTFDSEPSKRCLANVKWCIRSMELRRGVPESDTTCEGKGFAGFWQAMARFTASKETTWVIAQNMVQLLDVMDFWRRLESGDIEPTGDDWRQERGAGLTGEDRTSGLMVLDNPPTLVACRPRDSPGKWLLLDTRNFGFESMGDDHGHKGRCDRYLSGLRACLYTLRESSTCSLRCTAASQAVSILRSDWPVRSLHCHTDHRAAKLERGCELFGYCKAFVRGFIPGPVYHLDVRNMYAAIYRDMELPVSLRKYVDANQPSAPSQPSVPHHCIAYVRTRLGHDNEGLRSQRRGNDDSDIADAYLAGPRLARAVREDRILKWHCWAEYTCVPLLRGFANQWLATLASEREKGSELVAQWIKRILVAVPGKFGETGKRWVAVPRNSQRGPYCQWHGADPNGNECLYRNIAKWTQRREVYGESYHSIPAITAFVIAAGRYQLSNYLDIAGRPNVWYVDTDSLLCNTQAYTALLHGGFVRQGEVGYLREVARYSSCFVYDERHYECDDGIKCSGVPRGRIKKGQTRQDYWQREDAARGVYRPVWAHTGG